ncbi:MAG: serine/threonine protein kinase [Halobacteriovoraceae bacterium]|nr:serine/threonine protein kinase [Halobacteriovoraceae bacterium]
MSSEESFKIKRYGKYLLLNHLVDGGMAEIYLARELSINENDIITKKIIAVKMIKQVFSQDLQYKKMFLDEIQVTYGLQHPNIAQIYSYGEEKNRLYCVMEYVDGRSLREFIDILEYESKHFPIDMALHIVSQVCMGLDYAHKYTDKLTGKKSNIVHRDMSPSNVMIDYQGIIKIIDFGIAKAETNQEETQEGTIKGKFGYLAPECLMDGMTIDHRYDQFSTALILWELITGQRLFVHKNEMITLRNIYECNIPTPSSINPNIPPELDTVLLKALSRDREKRYSDMDQFGRELIKIIYKINPEFSSSDLGGFLSEKFDEIISKNRKSLRDMGEVDLRPYIEEMVDGIEAPSMTINKEAGTQTNIKVNLLQDGLPQVDIDHLFERFYPEFKEMREKQISLELSDGKNPTHSKPTLEEVLKSNTLRSKTEIRKRPVLSSANTKKRKRRRSNRKKKTTFSYPWGKLIRKLSLLSFFLYILLLFSYLQIWPVRKYVDNHPQIKRTMIFALPFAKVIVNGINSKLDNFIEKKFKEEERQIKEEFKNMEY